MSRTWRSDVVDEVSRWNTRHIPYPLLAPWTKDYVSGVGFSVQIPHSTRDNHDHINLTIRFELDSNYLKGLIEARRAKYLSIIECNETFRRIASSPSEGENEDIFVESASDFSGALSLVPYVVSTCSIDNFLSDEHADEIRFLNPQGFKVGPWSILARGNEQQIELDSNSNPNSVIDLVGSGDVEVGAFDIDLGENRIKIYVSHGDYSSLDSLRTYKSAIEPERVALMPALYFHAVVEALRNLAVHEDRGWHTTMRNALAEHQIEVDDVLNCGKMP